MTELMFKMTSWLIAAMALGFLVAWLLARIVYKTKRRDEEDTLSAVILERNNLIDKLEKKLRNEKVLLKKTSEDLKESEKAFAQKTSTLASLRSRLEMVNSSENETLELKQKQGLLETEVQRLKDIDRKRVKELEGFEAVLVRAENQLEDTETHYKKLLRNLDQEIDKLMQKNKLYKENRQIDQEKIRELKEDLKLYAANRSEPEFIISKDQFIKIEEQLDVYQKEIAQLKNEKAELMLQTKKELKSESINEDGLEEKVVESLRNESDDSSMVKVFRETYKKITKS